MLTVSVAGAGDCFTAAFMVGLLEGRSTAGAMRFAAAAASICVSRAGAQPSLPSRQELDQLLSTLV
jgi:ribokinase